MKKTLWFAMYLFLIIGILLGLTGCNKDEDRNYEVGLTVEAYSEVDNSIPYEGFWDGEDVNMIPNKTMWIKLTLKFENKENKENKVKGFFQNLFSPNKGSENNENEERVFAPIITISNTKGYKFDRKTFNFTLTTTNEGSQDEGQRIDGIEQPVPAGETKEIILEFSITCNKPNDGGSVVTQNWTLTENGEVMEEKALRYNVPNVKNVIQYNEDNFHYERNRIVFVKPTPGEKEAIKVYYTLIGENVKKMPAEEDGKYVIDINEGGKYTVKFTSSILSKEDYDKEFLCKKLDAPTGLKTQNGDSGAELVWSAVEGAISYEIMCEDETICTTEDTSLLLSKLPISDAGTYKITVKAISTDRLTFDSSPSNTCVVYKLSAPEIIKSSSMVTWTAVNRAQKYQIYVNDEYRETITETSYSVSGMYGMRIRVVAISEESNVISSGKSNEITATTF